MTAACRRVLFFAEAVTLAHVARPLVLAQSLPSDHYDCILAADPRYEKLYATSPVPRIAIDSIPTSQFTTALAKGNPIYTAAQLEKYVAQDTEVIQSARPDVIVGDMRLSLAISARKAGVPYMSLTNAYWSPYANVRFTIPQSDLTRWLPVGICQTMFDLLRPTIFAMHCKPMNQVLKRHDMPSLGSSLQRVYTEADHVLYADLPGLTPMQTLPANHHYLGPILWEPAMPLPEWWDRIAVPDASAAAGGNRKPVVYANLGSSGPAALLPVVLEALREMDVTVVAATAGKLRIDTPPANVLLADYLPGLQACKAADLVICNGGSPSTQQAIAAGKPMLCLPSNLDQFLNTQGMLDAGAAKMIRADRLTPDSLRAAVKQLIEQPVFQTNAAKVAQKASDMDAGSRLVDLIENHLFSHAAQASHN